MTSSERALEEHIRFLNSFYSPNRFPKLFFFKCKNVTINSSWHAIFVDTTGSFSYSQFVGSSLSLPHTRAIG